MALNENVKSLLRCVADDDIQKAKVFAKMIVENETAATNQYFCKSIKAKLDSQHTFVELPYDIKGLLKMEDVSNFNENRYYLTNEEKQIYEQIVMAKNTNSKLAEMKIRYLNSTLLYGESGTGKTTFGKYVAYKLGLPFAYLNFSQCISSYLGATSKNIEKVFEFIKKQKCVLMLDEIDAIGIKRGKEDLGEMSRVVIGLMQSFDMLDNDIIVIGATNRKDMIDEALIRRFSIIHEVKPIQTLAQLQQMIVTFLDDVGIYYNLDDIVKYANMLFKTDCKQNTIITNIIQNIVIMLNKGQSKFEIYEDNV